MGSNLNVYEFEFFWKCFELFFKFVCFEYINLNSCNFVCIGLVSVICNIEGYYIYGEVRVYLIN